MQFTEDHKLFASNIRKIIARDINPHIETWEEQEMFPAHELFKKLGAQGFLGLSKAEKYGGLGLDYSYEVLMAEELGHVHCGGVPMAIGVQSNMCTPALARFGSEQLKREFLAPSISGDLVGCIGVSEPGAGSDVAAIRTNARKDGDDYIINGTKMWITNGMQADWMCCLANTGEGPSHKNKSLIVVPLKSKGVERTRKLKKLGMWASDTAQLFFDDVRVPQSYCIGEEGRGFSMQMQQFQEERLWAAANCLGMLDEIISDTVEYTKDRKTFGKSIIDNQWVKFHLAELLTETESQSALTSRSTEQSVHGEDVTRFATNEKHKARRLPRQVGDTCLQYWGGMGYMWESKVSRLFRDGRLLSIGAGADEIMLGILCKLEQLHSDAPV